MTIRLILADDHPLVLDGLERLFSIGDEFEIVGRCATGEEALAAVRRLRPDILVLDIRLPGMDGLAVLRALDREKLPTRAVVLTAGLEEWQVVEAMHAGLRGLVLKGMAPELLLRCVRKVHAGEQWLERHATQQALDRLLQRDSGSREAASLLTPREIEIVRMVAGGQRNREIAERLGIGEGTVKTHLHNIYQKLGIETRFELLRWAEEKGLA